MNIYSVFVYNNEIGDGSYILGFWVIQDDYNVRMSTQNESKSEETSLKFKNMYLYKIRMYVSSYKFHKYLPFTTYLAQRFQHTFLNYSANLSLVKDENSRLYISKFKKILGVDMKLHPSSCGTFYETLLETYFEAPIQHVKTRKNISDLKIYFVGFKIVPREKYKIQGAFNLNKEPQQIGYFFEINLILKKIVATQYNIPLTTIIQALKEEYLIYFRSNSDFQAFVTILYNTIIHNSTLSQSDH